MWESYHNTGNVNNNEHLKEMLWELVNTANALKNVNERYCAMTIDYLMREWTVLNDIAVERGLKDIPKLI